MPSVAILSESSLSPRRLDLASASTVFFFLCGWHWRVTGALTAGAIAALLLVLVLCLAYGSVFIRAIGPVFQCMPGVPFQLLTGYFVFNSLLFFLALCSPLGITANLAILSLAALVALLAVRRRTLPADDGARSGRLGGYAAILIACIGATIWCGDIQMPLQLNGSDTVFHVWPDAFTHAREISVFTQSHGLGSVHDIKLAGAHAPIYHFASYLSPAVISALSGASAMQVYASFQLPFGIFLTGLAAFCLMGKLFGVGPGLAATVAIILVPDAFQQGFQNRYLSYNFLAQVNLGMLYGIACAALAWMFMLDGCRRGKFGPVLLAYAFLVVCLLYKAHLFVANSYVLMMFPFLFLTPVRRSWRIGLGVLATGLFCLVLSWSQSNPGVPVMRIDGSGIGGYLVQLLKDYQPGWMRQVFTHFFLQEKHSAALQALYAAGLLLLSTFGLWLAALALALAKTWRTMPHAAWAFRSSLSEIIWS